MSRPQFDYLLSKVEHCIRKADTVFRFSISPEERLMVTLRYLATGCSMTQLHYEWGLSVAAVSKIIPETCRAIYECMKDTYLETPNTVQQWQEISQKLEDNWNFPNALGALDGKHIVMTKPHHAGSEFHNYKGTESIVLLAMCDSNYSFTYVDVGAQGRASDGGIFAASSLQQAIHTNSMNFPQQRCPPNSEAPLPYVILADEAFPLRTNIMRPYSRRTLNHEKRIFNYRLSRVRRLIENAFGILAATWRILLRRIDLEPEKTQTLTLACCTLHNYLRKSRTPPCGAPPSASNRNDNVVEALELPAMPSIPPQHLRPSEAAIIARDTICEYVNTAGAVAWQNNMVMDD